MKPGIKTEQTAPVFAELNLTDQKALLYRRMMAELAGFGLSVDESLSAPERPWGAYIRLPESALDGFLSAYWPDIKSTFTAVGDLHLAPKILMVSPGSRLSLQYHHRRQEYWRVLAGPIKIVLGADGATLQEFEYNAGDVIKIPCGYWHRIAGLNGWGVIAELWEHITPENPSDEEDIVRVEDDFSRKTG